MSREPDSKYLYAMSRTEFRQWNAKGNGIGPAFDVAGIRDRIRSYACIQAQEAGYAGYTIVAPSGHVVEESP